MARAVETPGGERWKVGRQWAPWRPRLRRRRDDDNERAVGEGGNWALEALSWGDDILGGAMVALVVGLLVVLALLVVWPVVAIAIEVTIIILGVLGATLARVVFRRPWVIRAHVPGTYQERAWRVKGWRSSRDMIDSVSWALERGMPLPPPRAGDDALSR